jgi:outer membrane protein OmpA-like peptidoglycan-associated protein
VCAVLAAPGALAEDAPPSYTADDVVSHFVNSIDLGQTRTLCIGTPTECGEAEAAAAPSVAPEAAPWDLLVNFELNSAELMPEARLKLDVFAEAMRDRRLRRAVFKIEGHTDALGTPDFNQDLSERRAAAVVDYLVERGIDRSRLVAVGYGETRPLSEDAYEDVNRRVEASLTTFE